HASWHWSEPHVVVRIDTNLAQHPLQSIDRSRRGADAQAFERSEVATLDSSFAIHDQEPIHALRQCAKQLAALPILERVERRVRGATDKIEPAIAQIFVGASDREHQFDRSCDALLAEEAELDRSD